MKKIIHRPCHFNVSKCWMHFPSLGRNQQDHSRPHPEQKLFQVTLYLHHLPGGEWSPGKVRGADSCGDLPIGARLCDKDHALFCRPIPGLYPRKSTSLPKLTWWTWLAPRGWGSLGWVRCLGSPTLELLLLFVLSGRPSWVGGGSFGRTETAEGWLLGVWHFPLLGVF